MGDPISKSVELVRVRGDATENLPASFYSATNALGSEPVASGTPAPGAMRMTYEDSLDTAAPESGG